MRKQTLLGIALLAATSLSATAHESPNSGMPMQSGQTMSGGQGQMPMQPGRMPMKPVQGGTGQIPAMPRGQMMQGNQMNNGQMPMHRGQMPMNHGQMPMHSGQPAQ